MPFKDKCLIVFITIITFGLIWIKWSKPTKPKNYLTVNPKITVNLEQLFQHLGSKNNIISSSCTHTKIKIQIKDIKLVQDPAAIQQLKGISGVVVGQDYIHIIVGNSAKTINEKIQELLEK